MAQLTENQIYSAFGLEPPSAAEGAQVPPLQQDQPNPDTVPTPNPAQVAQIRKTRTIMRATA